MAKNSGSASATAPRLHDPVTTRSAVSILRTLIASAAAGGQAYGCKEGDAAAVGDKVEGSLPAKPASNQAVTSTHLSAAEAKALQPDIVLAEGQDTEEGQNHGEQANVTAPQYGGDDRDVEDDNAYELLVDGLRTGRLIACFVDDTATVAIPAAYWATGVGRATARQGYRLDRLGDGSGVQLVYRYAVVSKNDVHSLIGAEKPRNNGGRPVKYEWEAIMFDIWAYAIKRGIPKTQAQFFDDVASFLGNRSPQSDTGLKERTDKVFKEFSKFRQSEAISQSRKNLGS